MAIVPPALHATPSATREARILTVVAHVSGVFGIAPSAAMYLLLRDDDQRTAEQSRLALNWQLTLGVLLVIAIIADFVLSTLAFSVGALGVVSALAWILVLPWAVGAAVAVWAGIRLARGGTWSYPWSIQFVRSVTESGRERPDDQPAPLATLALGFGLAGGVLGIVFGHVARARIRRTGEAGWGTATAGLAIGYAEVIVAVVIASSILLSMAVIAPLST